MCMCAAEPSSSGVAAGGGVCPGQWPTEPRADYIDSDDVPSGNKIVGAEGPAGANVGCLLGSKQNVVHS